MEKLKPNNDTKKTRNEDAYRTFQNSALGDLMKPSRNLLPSKSQEGKYKT